MQAKIVLAKVSEAEQVAGIVNVNGRENSVGIAPKIFVQAVASRWKSTKDFFEVVLATCRAGVLRGFCAFEFHSALFEFGEGILTQSR